MIPAAPMTHPAAPTDVLVPRIYRLAGATRETPDMRTLELISDDGRPLAFAPGQFTMISVFGVGECAMSLSGDPGAPERVRHTVRAVGTVTRALHRLAPGDVVGVRGPFGTGWPLPEAVGGDLLIVAGGCGLAPLRPAVLHALAHRPDYGRVAVLVGVRTGGDLPFRAEVAAWDARDDLDVRITVDRVTGDWDGPVGLVTELVPTARVDPAATTALVCGPELMMRQTIDALAARGIGADRIHVSLERTMRCGVGTCGHCQLGPVLVCRDGPVLTAARVGPLLEVDEL